MNMPLLDHFHEPLYPSHAWESFHTRWAVSLADDLQRQLPSPRYLAEVHIHVGPRVEADIAEFEFPGAVSGEIVNGATSGGVAVQTWAPPVAAQTVAIVFPDDIEVQVFDLRDGKQLVAVIELISPGNKDRPEVRRAFAAKCVAYLQRGIGLINVDIVTSRSANSHNDVLALLSQAEGASMPEEVDLYAVAYRPARRGEENLLDLWPVPLAVGQPLPVLPLALRGAFFVPVDLETTYSEARQRSRL
jgi:hypothetical protein